jgi:hypothetical protein
LSITATYHPGDRVEVHDASCGSGEQHARVVKGGHVVKVVPGPALDVRLDDGTDLELYPGDSPSWRPGSCPALQAHQSGTGAAA